MYESLQKQSKAFHLYIFAFDDDCNTILRSLRMENTTIISLNDFENETLLLLKRERTKTEYCWTCTPWTIEYCLEKYKLNSCTYLDADIYFFSDPSELIIELKDKDVLITEHRYSPEYDQSKTSGKYCVQFMTFKNTYNGRKVLEWWKKACTEWCYNRIENDKFGDQKYLDDWLQRFTGVHELKHLGGGVAPWNIQQYDILNKDGVIKGKKKDNGTSFDVVFFHFHSLKYINNNKIELANGYRLNKSVKKNIYNTYLKHLETIKINYSVNIADLSENIEEKWSLVRQLRKIKSYLKNRNIYTISKFLEKNG